MSRSLAALNLLSSLPTPKCEVRPVKSWRLSNSYRAQTVSRSRKDGQGGRRVWRRRKLIQCKGLLLLHILSSVLCSNEPSPTLPEEEKHEHGIEEANRDPTLDIKLERVPFLEEQVRKINEGGGVLSMDIERLLLSEDNRFEFVNEVAAEATEYVENNRDEYGHKKAILHVLSNRINDAGFYRPEGYMEADPFKPGPGYLKEFFT